MKHVVKSAWRDMFLPIFKRPKRIQVAALCYRNTPAGKEVLLITSRDTGRWIVPKGWPIDGFDGPGAALQEAWEEAGVKDADIQSEPVGVYGYDKNLGDGLTTPVMATVYLTEIGNLADTYPESEMRQRQWFTPDAAAQLVQEPELKAILRQL